jgi:hypothetical protein
MKLKFWELIEDIFTDKDIRTYVGLICIAIAVSLYGYYRPKTISPTDVQSLVVILDSKPDYTEQNGDNIANISFKSAGYSGSFDISHCALSLINPNDITSLNIGDTLNVLVNNQNLIEADKFITVCGINIKGKGTILDLSNYNSCQRNNWKEVYFLGLTFAIILSLTVFWKIIRHIKKTMANGI